MTNLTPDVVRREMELRFTSGNAVPVERAMIRAKEWRVLEEERKEMRDALSAMLRAMEEAIDSGDWQVDGRNDPEIVLRRAEKVLGIDTARDKRITREAIGKAKGGNEDE